MNRIFLGLIILALPACSTLGSFVKPEVSVVNFYLENATLFETTANLTVRIDNENSFPLDIEGAVHRLYLNDTYLGKGFDRDGFQVPRLSSTTSEIEIHISNLSMLTKLGSLMEKEALTYKVESTLHPKGRLARRVTVSDSGNFDFVGLERSLSGTSTPLSASIKRQSPVSFANGVSDSTMARDFAKELKNEKFWDRETEEIYQEEGVPLVDRALQTREEIIAFCDWISANDISSYLEIGIWTGRLVQLFHRLFDFQTTAACDLAVAKSFGLEIDLSDQIKLYEGNSLSPIYQNWRKKLGQLDLILIDASHQYEEVKRDFEINREFPHRFIAFHGIAGSEHTGDGVSRFWNELSGNKVEIIRPHREIGSDKASMGIGIWSE